MKINIDSENSRIWLKKDDCIAFVEYDIINGYLDIKHTFVPPPLEGTGIASMLVKFTYDYAKEHGLKPKATCLFAIIWLKRHPKYSE